MSDHEVAWLIEDTRARVKSGVPLYYAAAGWTTDHMKAVRYARREDAERTVMGLPNGWHLIGDPVEHEWCAPFRPTNERNVQALAEILMSGDMAQPVGDPPIFNLTHLFRVDDAYRVASVLDAYGVLAPSSPTPEPSDR